MNTETPVERIRQAIAWQLEHLGVQEIDSIHETILIHNGMFCGRKFECEDYQVVWFIEEDEIKFFSPVGDLLRATSAIDCLQRYDVSEQARRAA